MEQYNTEPLTVFKKHAFHVFTNPLEIPHVRSEDLAAKLNVYRLKIKPEDLDEWIDIILDHLAKGDAKKAYQSIYKLKRYRQLEDHNHILDIVMSIVLIDNEPENIILKKYTDLKSRLIKENPELHGFFLTIGQDTIRKMNTGTMDIESEGFFPQQPQPKVST